MAKEQRNRKHDPDTQRDFETGTVNPGPGMAPPHSADDLPAGSMTGAGESDAGGKPQEGEADAAGGRREGE
jgi:hypothetical protein